MIKVQGTEQVYVEMSGTDGLANGYYFADETGSMWGPYTTVYDAELMFHKYCKDVLKDDNTTV